MEVRTIELQGKVRGVRWVATPPDVRYRRYHEVYAHPSETRVGDCVKVIHPARYSERTGELLCAEGSAWQSPESGYVDPCARRGRFVVDPTCACGPTLLSTGETLRWARGNEPGKVGIVATLFSGKPQVILASEDSDVAALIAELDQLDAVWIESHRDALLYEDRTQDAVARAVSLEGVQLTSTETECLECGAVYDRVGLVEAGGMSCKRCG